MEIQITKEKTYRNFVDTRLAKKSKGYSEAVQTTLRKLDEWCLATYKKSRDQVIIYIKTLEGEKRDDAVIDWLQSFLDSYDGRISYKVFYIYASHIKKYLRYHKIRIDLKDELEPPMQVLEERYALPLDEMQHIIQESNWKHKGYYLSLASCGARPIEIMCLKKKDYSWTGKRWSALIPAKFTKKKMSRTVFFSTECTPYISKILKNLDDDDRVWTTQHNDADDDIRIRRHTAGCYFRSVCSKIGYNEKYETSGFYKHNMYCFRAFFYTKALDNLDSKDLAHALIGHGAYLPEYMRKTIAQKEELYEEIESAILIFDQSQNEKKIRELKQANAELMEMRGQIKEHDLMFKRMESNGWYEKNVKYD